MTPSRCETLSTQDRTAARQIVGETAVDRATNRVHKARLLPRNRIFGRDSERSVAQGGAIWQLDEERPSFPFAGLFDFNLQTPSHLSAAFLEISFLV
jgi:hypothetical protein